MVRFQALQRMRVLSFGRRTPFTFAIPVERAPFSAVDDARLFLTTFVGGLLFMTVYLA